MKTKIVQQSLVVILILVSLAALIAIHLRLRIYAQDDAYIHFRIVRNWVEYGVPYYNPSERVMATSSVGWTIILYGIAQASRFFQLSDLPTWTAALNGLLIGLGALVHIFLIGRIANKQLSAIVIFFLAIVYFSQMINPSLGLMETPLTFLLVGLGLIGLITGKPSSLIIFGILPFFRLELVVLSGLAVIYAIAVRQWHINTLSYMLLGAIPFLIFDGYYFGTFIPNTIKAKAIVYQLSLIDTIGRQITILEDDILLLRFFLPLNMKIRTIYVFFALLLNCGWIVIFFYRELRKILRSDWMHIDKIGVLFAAWSMNILGAYIVSHTFIFTWYRPLYTIPLFLLIIHTLIRSKKRLLSWILLPAVLAQALVPTEAILAASVSPVYYLDFGVGARARQYHIIGRELYACYPQAKLMTSEIGGLGYGFKGFILDGAGLTTPEALHYHPMNVPDERSNGSIGAIPYPFIVDTNPELIVSYDIFIKTFLKSPKAEEYFHYQLPMLTEGDFHILGFDTFWGSNALHLFIRRDLIDSGSYCPALGVLP